ncbi:MAG: tetratricopeptide repeat protein, partial [Gemmatimonadaceae bacterium]
TFARGRTYSRAERLWADTVEKEPGNARAWDNYGAAILRADSTRLADAAARFREAISIDSTYVPAWANLASVEISRDHLPAARHDLERALALNPDYAHAVAMMGNVLEAEGDPQRAIPYLERVEANQPSVDDLAALGAAYMDAGRPAAAEPVLRRALGLDPSRADVSRSLGGALLDQQRVGDAILVLESAVRQDQTSAFGLGLLSFAYVEDGRIDDGIAAAQRAAALGGGDVGALIFAGRAMLHAGRLADAAQDFSEAVKLAPTNPEAITRYGIAEAANGRLAEAARLFRRALVIAPGYPPAVSGLQRLSGAR